MPKVKNGSRGSLALAIAGGLTVRAWAKSNGVPERTAYRWARLPEVIDQVERIRLRAIGRAVGRLVSHATAAADRIAKLSKSAENEAVSLAASRAVLSDLMTLAGFESLERRVAAMERRQHENGGLAVGGAPVGVP